MYFMDMHCHMLPGVDDGARDMDTAMEMIGIAYSQGIRSVMFTPHYYLGKTKHSADKLREVFEVFSARVLAEYKDIKLYLGTEIYYEKGVVKALKDGQILSLADTQYVLVEFSPRVSYTELYGAIRELVQGRFRPVIAHVERYQCLIKHVERIHELTENGAYLQMNASSLCGGIFDSHVKWCRKLVLEGYISILGTDAHDTEERGPYVEQTVSWLQKKLEPIALELICRGNGELLVQNQYLK